MAIAQKRRPANLAILCFISASAGEIRVSIQPPVPDIWSFCPSRYRRSHALKYMPTTALPGGSQSDPLFTRAF
jgi:hypothetical protein